MTSKRDRRERERVGVGVVLKHLPNCTSKVSFTIHLGHLKELHVYMYFCMNSLLVVFVFWECVTQCSLSLVCLHFLLQGIQEGFSKWQGNIHIDSHLHEVFLLLAII